MDFYLFFTDMLKLTSYIVGIPASCCVIMAFIADVINIPRKDIVKVFLVLVGFGAGMLLGAMLFYVMTLLSSHPPHPTVLCSSGMGDCTSVRPFDIWGSRITLFLFMPVSGIIIACSTWRLLKKW